MTFPVLQRYSKPRRAGDQTSGGRGKLLRPTSALSRIELLVRETLQNSWDAKDPEWTPAYGVRIYEMEPDVQRVLHDSVFTDLPDSLSKLDESLRVPGVRAIEIYDRGTDGLNGPYRASEPGNPNNFTSFVFDIGTTKSSESSGGTYGFGKTAAFEVSNAHSVVYWSRCRGTGGAIEHRLIASTLDDTYEQDGARYTGAHWWGALEERDDIVPLRGEPARQLGEAIFRTHFGDTEDGDPETGTSILVIDPVISYSLDGHEETREIIPVRSKSHEAALLLQLADALAHSAWPKVVPLGEDNERMLVGLYDNRVPRNVQTDILEKYAPYASALTQIRREQGELDDGFTFPDPPGIVRQSALAITLRRPRNGTASISSLFGTQASVTIGHLHLVESVGPAGTPRTAPANALCLMRHEAELVVRYDRVVHEEENLLQWHGVFKPTREFDRHFREAEPPTHDRWTPDSAQSEASRYVVKKALEHLRNKTRAFLSETRSQDDPGQQRSVRNVALSLRGFVPLGSVEHVQEAASPRHRARTARARSTEPKSIVKILRAQPLSGASGQDLELLVESRDGGKAMITTSIYALTADGKLPLTTDEALVEWLSDGVAFATGNKCLAESGQKLQMLIRTPTAVALEVGFESVNIA